MPHQPRPSCSCSVSGLAPSSPAPAWASPRAPAAFDGLLAAVVLAAGASHLLQLRTAWLPAALAPYWNRYFELADVAGTVLLVAVAAPLAVVAAAPLADFAAAPLAAVAAQVAAAVAQVAAVAALLADVAAQKAAAAESLVVAAVRLAAPMVAAVAQVVVVAAVG